MSTQFDSSPGFRSDAGAAIALALGATLGATLAAWLAGALAADDAEAAWLAVARAEAPGAPVHAEAINRMAASNDSRWIRRPVTMSSSCCDGPARPGPLLRPRRRAHLYH